MSDFEITRIDEVIESVKERANEISHRLHDDDIESIKKLLEDLELLKNDLQEFNEVIDEAWEDTEVF